MEDLEEYVRNAKIVILIENQKNIYNAFYDRNYHEGREDALEVVMTRLRRGKEVESYLQGLVDELNKIADRENETRKHE